MRTLLVHATLAALAAGCAKTPKDSSASSSGGAAPRALEAPGPAPADSRFSGMIAGHRFTITVEGGRVFRCTHEEHVDDPDSPAGYVETPHRAGCGL